MSSALLKLVRGLLAFAVVLAFTSASSLALADDQSSIKIIGGAPPPPPLPPPPPPTVDPNGPTDPSGPGPADPNAIDPSGPPPPPMDPNAQPPDDPDAPRDPGQRIRIPPPAPPGSKVVTTQSAGDAPPPPAPTTPSATTPPPPANPNGSGMRTVDVPAGKKMEDVVVPEGAITGNGKGIGEPIVELHIVDNQRTMANTIEYISGIKRGQILSEQLVETARLRLYSTGLFKDVSITWGPPSPHLAGQGIRVTIRALDKFPWVIAPLISYQSRDYGGGLAFAHNNVLGRGIKLLLYADYTTAAKMFLAVWLDPSIRNTPFYYRIDAILRRDDIVEYARGRLGDPRVERQTNLDTLGLGALLGVTIARRFHIDARLKVYYDWTRTPSCYNTTSADQSGTPDVVAYQGGVCHAPSSSGWDNTITTSMGWDSRSKVNGVQKGLQVTLTWQYGAPWLGDNWSYHLLNLTGVYAFRFFKEHNLLIRWGGDLDWKPPFKLEVEAGSLDYTLRGYIYRQFRGDTSAHATVEYIVPMFTIKGLSVRGIGFFDSNLTWFRDLPAQDSTTSRLVHYGSGFRDYLPDTASGLHRDSWNNGVGAGIRMYLRGVILPLVGFDVGYGLEARQVQYYLSIGSVLD